MQPVRIELDSPKDPAAIRLQLNAALEFDRELRMGTAEYRANRSHIGCLLRQLAMAEPIRSAAFTAEDYATWKDTFEAMAQERIEKTKGN